MAIFSYRMGDRVCRGAGQSAVKVAAYQARENLVDARTGYAYNYHPRERSRQEPVSSTASASAYIGRDHGYDEGRKEALFVGLYAPENAPDWTRDRENIEQFWSRAEQAERRQDAQIAERIIIALPSELSLEQNIWLLQDHVKEFTRQGRVVQVAIHAPEHGDARNVHAHLLVSMRGVDEHGFKASKAETQERYLHRREYVEQLRERWAEAANRHLGRHGHAERIDHRTLAEQGIDRTPTMHLGPGDSRRERRGERNAAGEINREISTRNTERATLIERTPAIDRAVRVAADRKPELPKSPATTVRLYRGETATREGDDKTQVPAWVMESSEYRETVAATGRWFTKDLAEAKHYAKVHGGDETRISYVDVPAADVEKYLSANQPAARRFSAAGRETSEYFVSREIADTRQPYDHSLASENSDTIRADQRPAIDRAARIARLKHDSVVDRVPSGWRDLTTEDLAREMSPTYAASLKEVESVKADIVKAGKAAQYRQIDKTRAEDAIEHRTENLGLARKVLHKIGLRDRQIDKHEKEAKKAAYLADKMRTRRWALGEALRQAEAKRDAEFEKVRPQAKTTLAERKARAESARTELRSMQRERERERPAERSRHRARNQDWER